MLNFEFKTSSHRRQKLGSQSTSNPKFVHYETTKVNSLLEETVLKLYTVSKLLWYFVMHRICRTACWIFMSINK